MLGLSVALCLRFLNAWRLDRHLCIMHQLINGFSLIAHFQSSMHLTVYFE